ncbi:MAG: MBOAT family protein [Lachnospiraceae bacterium]|nr:MBOAT family protein [Lachnospiraceae bacterium]
MLFNSYIFVLLFFPVTVILYHLINKTGHYTLSKLFLLAMSLWFYCYERPEGVIVLLISILINYMAASFLFPSIKNEALKKFSLAAVILINLLILFYFKYMGFFADIINHITGGDLRVENIILPLGISFFTFSQISYVTDSYREPDTRYSFLDYALFISFFPKISVGPIAFAKEMIPQFNDTLKKVPDHGNISRGLFIFALGLSKKVLIADNMAKMADWGYSNIVFLDTPLSLIIILSYTMQIYYDFSGYCDMATGVCKMLNIDLPVNFDSPYRSLSINEFWKRWHITLTRFFRNYIYFPLGGSRKGTARTYINILIIYFISGIWHGADYTFIVWGLLYGVGMCISKAVSPISVKWPKAVRFILTFSFVNLAWVFFRADSVATAIQVIKTLFSFTFNEIPPAFVVSSVPIEFELIQWLLATFYPGSTVVSGFIMILLLLIFAIMASIFMKNPIRRAENFKPSGKYVVMTVILITWSVLSLSEVTPFLYTNF